MDSTPNPLGSLVIVTGDTDRLGHWFAPGTVVRVLVDDYLLDGTYLCEADDSCESFWVSANDLAGLDEPAPLKRGQRVRLVAGGSGTGMSAETGAIAYVVEPVDEDGWLQVRFDRTDARVGGQMDGCYLPGRFVADEVLRNGDRVYVHYDVQEAEARDFWSGPATVIFGEDDPLPSVIGVLTDSGFHGGFGREHVAPLHWR